MSSHPSLRSLYDFSGWVVQQIQVTPTIAVVKLHRDKRLNVYCPHCIRKASVNKKVMQSAYDLPIGPVNLVQVLYEALQGIAVVAKVILPCTHRGLTVTPMQPNASCTMCADYVVICQSAKFQFFYPSQPVLPGDGINEYWPGTFLILT